MPEIDSDFEALWEAAGEPDGSLPEKYVALNEWADSQGVKRGTAKRWVHEGMPSVLWYGERYVDPKLANKWTDDHAFSITFGRRSFVYFAQATDGGPIKIGFTSDVARRMYELGKRARFTRTYHALVSFPGDKRAERDLQNRFAALRIAGEWFRPDADIMAFIASRKTALAADEAAEGGSR